jgi:hypothetical protein
VLPIEDNLGYGAYQIDNPMTLADLRSLITRAITSFGEDAEVVTDNGQTYGARFGRISPYEDISTATFRSGDDDE